MADIKLNNWLRLVGDDKCGLEVNLTAMLLDYYNLFWIPKHNVSAYKEVKSFFLHQTKAPDYEFLMTKINFYISEKINNKKEGMTW